MNIGFDAKRAFLNYTGLGNYSRAVIESLNKYQSQDSFFLYTTKAANNARTRLLTEHKRNTVRTPPVSFLKSLWRSKLVTAQLVKDKIDVYHGLSNELPGGLHRACIKSVVTIHDLIFLRYPQYYKAADRAIYGAKFSYACRQADIIVAISQQTKNDLVTYLGANPSKIEVIYQSCDESFLQPQSEQQLAAVKERYLLPEQYILSVGTVEERKNLMVTIRALASLPKELKLVVVGRHTAYTERIKKYIRERMLEDRILFLQHAEFADLPAIYRMAKVFVYPSRFEGFGIPILEALHGEVPVIAATGSCLEEAGGPGSLYIAPDDDAALAGHIKTITEDNQVRDRMIKEGLQHASGISNQLMVEQLMQVYRR